MLVLLIIFLITIPVVTTSIPVTLPNERVEVRETKPENVIISVDVKGDIYWYDAKVPGEAFLVDKLKKVSTLSPSPKCRSAATSPRGMRAWQGAAGLPARRHHQGGLHHRTAAAGRLTA